KRKKIVVASSVFDGGRVSTQLVAQQDGKAGDWIELENPQSGRKLRGQVQVDGSVLLGSGRLGGYGTLATSQNDPKVSAGRAD
ncbi:MAG: Chaperone for flagella basal body P-ring formation, partial [Pseudomonadota bacterium]